MTWEFRERALQVLSRRLVRTRQACRRERDEERVDVLIKQRLNTAARIRLLVEGKTD